MSYTREQVADAVDHYVGSTIPVHLSLQASQVVLSQPEMELLLSNADCIGLADCECRLERQNCAAPLDVCLSLGETARKLIAEGRARPVSISRALGALRRSHQAGLVHLAYRKEGSDDIEAVCSCCACCCWFLTELQRFDYHDALAESAFAAVFDRARCDGCGVCAERCPFQAWERTDDAALFDQERCFGCGLCVTACPVNAISLVQRSQVIP
jgi:NAD-dependent dihydropyrimidine dehydrogenase PreA subunit